jgi:hypothetical protein
MRDTTAKRRNGATVDIDRRMIDLTNPDDETRTASFTSSNP